MSTIYESELVVLVGLSKRANDTRVHVQTCTLTVARARSHLLRDRHVGFSPRVRVSLGPRSAD